jgi:hypothetical protein
MGVCECGNEPLSSIKCGEFLDRLASEEILLFMELVITLASDICNAPSSDIILSYSYTGFV